MRGMRALTVSLSLSLSLCLCLCLSLSLSLALSLPHQGVLRQLPLVGSVVNWWSPFKKPEIKGRSFDLTKQALLTGTTDSVHAHLFVSNCSLSLSLSLAKCRSRPRRDARASLSRCQPAGWLAGHGWQDTLAGESQCLSERGQHTASKHHTHTHTHTGTGTGTCACEVCDTRARGGSHATA